MVRIAQDLVESCELRRSNKDITHSYEAEFELLAKLYLLVVNYVFNTSSQSDLSKICWVPAMQEAESFYDIAGKWEVDAKCVSSLQTISVKSLRHFLTSESLPHFGEFPPVMDQAKQLFLYLFEIPDDSERVLQFLNEYSDFSLQALWYPPFKRFLGYAKQRSQDNSSIVSVSCKGLQGSRDEVYNTTLQLLRLMIVNELHHQNFDLNVT